MSILRQLDFEKLTPERAGAVLGRLELEWASKPGLFRGDPSVLPLSRTDNRDQVGRRGYPRVF